MAMNDKLTNILTMSSVMLRILKVF